MGDLRIELQAPVLSHKNLEESGYYMSHCQNSSKFLSVSYLMKTADVIMNFSSSHNTTDHT